ncbi:MAG: hypothetical protein WA006_09975 [Rhodoglobus sp.]
MDGAGLIRDAGSGASAKPPGACLGAARIPHPVPRGQAGGAVRRGLLDQRCGDLGADLGGVLVDGQDALNRVFSRWAILGSNQ